MCVAVIICPVPFWGRKAYFASQTQRYFSPSLEERQGGAGFVVGAGGGVDEQLRRAQSPTSASQASPAEGHRALKVMPPVGNQTFKT